MFRYSFMCGIKIFVFQLPITKQVPVYIAEITPKNLRGGFATTHQVKQNHYNFKLKNNLVADVH